MSCTTRFFNKRSSPPLVVLMPSGAAENFNMLRLCLPWPSLTPSAGTIRSEDIEDT